MSIETDLRRWAELFEDAADNIAKGIEGSFSDEEAQHPMAKDMRKVERRCRAEAKRLRALLPREGEKT